MSVAGLGGMRDRAKVMQGWLQVAERRVKEKLRRMI